MKINKKKSHVNFSATANIPLMLRRQKRLANEDRKQVCKATEYASVTFEYTNNIFNMFNSSAVVASFLGLPITTVVSASAHTGKLISDMTSVYFDCSSLPFEEIKEVLGERFNQVDQTLARIENKVDRNFIALKSGFINLKNEIRNIVKHSKQVSRYAPEEFRPSCPRNSFA